MERRRNYRHTFQDSLAAEILVSGRPPARRARIVNLSLGGTVFVLEDQTIRLHADTWLIVRFKIPSGQFDYPARVIHNRLQETTVEHGAEFLPLSDARINQVRERSLWAFLIEEQRRAVRTRQVH